MNMYQLHAVSLTQQGRQKQHFRRILEALRAEWRNSTPRFASTPERRNKDINLNTYFISSIGIESTTSGVYSYTMYPCATTGLINEYNNVIIN